MNKYGVEEPRDVYWDIRLRPELKTLEFRVMDSQIDANSTIMIVSFILLLFKYLNQFNRVEELEKEIQLPDEEELKKNRFAAEKFGLESEFTISGEQGKVQDRIIELIETSRSGGDTKWIDLLIENVKNNITGAKLQITSSNPIDITDVLVKNFVD
jgi:carboxylate-amine ligase